MSSFPDYYALLDVPQSASQEAIRQAYKRESLKNHPDRQPNASPEARARATAKFQAIADAYYVLSDPKRKREYDLQWTSKSSESRSQDPNASADFFANFANFFASNSSPGTNQTPQEAADAGFGQRPDANGVFGNVFEELLRPEVHRVVPWWTYIGAVSGAGLGYIVANLPGLIAGGIAGNRLGAIRDAKGRSVAAVFSELGGDQKAQVLKALAMKVLGSAL